MENVGVDVDVALLKSKNPQQRKNRRTQKRNDEIIVGEKMDICAAKMNCLFYQKPNLTLTLVHIALPDKATM